MFVGFVFWLFFIIIIYLTCSGETKFNKEGLLQGKALKEPHDLSLWMLSVCLSWLCRFPVSHKGQAIDASLSEIGQQQAEAAGQYLKDVRFSNVFVSDMLRAKQVECFALTLEAKEYCSIYCSSPVYCLTGGSDLDITWLHLFWTKYFSFSPNFCFVKSVHLFQLNYINERIYSNKTRRCIALIIFFKCANCG